jgi:hypothetical protein
MAVNRMLITVLLFISLVVPACSQGYMGTVSTGTGIVPPLTVGLSSASGVNLGKLSTLPNLTGSWSVDLKGQQIRHLDLQIFQESDLILGYGQITADGASQTVSAAGSAAGDSPTVFISLIDRPEVFRLKLSSSGTALAGGYDSLSVSGVRESGTVTGSMVLAATQNQPAPLGAAANPSATYGALVGAATGSLAEGNSTGHSIESRNFYQSSTGQGATTSDGSTVASSYG